MKINILGIKIDNLTKTQVLKEIEQYLESPKQHYIVTPYSEFIVRAQKDQEFKEILNSADLAVPDGMGIIWAGNVFYELMFRGSGFIIKILKITFSGLAMLFCPGRLKSIFPEKISGADLIWNIAEIAAGAGKTIFLLGGWDNTPGVVAAKLKNQYPDLSIVGAYAGSSDAKEEKDIIEMIGKVKPDILLVAFGPVKQEKWMAKNLSKMPFVKLAIGLGGTFDYLAQKRIRAPKFMRIRGLEWFFRLFTQPRRIGRIGKAIPKFVWLVTREKIKSDTK